jgi:hypothetical protein
MLPALDQAHHEAQFLEQQPLVFEKLRLQYALDIETDTDSQVYRIQCHGDIVAATLVERIKGRLSVTGGWRIEVI